MDLRLAIQLGIIGFAFFMLINASAVLVLAERKIMGFMQQRFGPYLVGRTACCSRWPTSSSSS
jgi:NADH:ubiquinone oxidoreductase subunit H